MSALNYSSVRTDFGRLQVISRMLELILYVVSFVVLSGLMAMIEAAILSISRCEVEEMVLGRRWGALSLRAITSRLPRAMVIIVLITNLINVLGPILVGTKAIYLYGDAVIAFIVGLLTVATILFSEIIPKSLGTHYAPAVSRAAAPIVLGLIYVLYPLVFALDWIVSLLKSGERRIGTEAQIRSLVSVGRRAGHIESDEGQLIHRAFALNDKIAADIMTRLQDVVSIAAAETVKQSAQRVFHTEFSRYPVFGKSVHDVTGMVLSRDVLAALSEGKDAESVLSIVRPSLTVPASLHLDQLLVLFRDHRIHLAIVQDGDKTVGVVTLEDVLEELVGEIEDEKDAKPDPLWTASSTRATDPREAQPTGLPVRDGREAAC